MKELPIDLYFYLSICSYVSFNLFLLKALQRAVHTSSHNSIIDKMRDCLHTFMFFPIFLWLFLIRYRIKSSIDWKKQKTLENEMHSLCTLKSLNNATRVSIFMPCQLFPFSHYSSFLRINWNIRNSQMYTKTQSGCIFMHNIKNHVDKFIVQWFTVHFTLFLNFLLLLFCFCLFFFIHSWLHWINYSFEKNVFEKITAELSGIVFQQLQNMQSLILATG